MFEPLFVTSSGVEITGFRSSGDEALRWWERLRRDHPASGLWPVLMETDTHLPGYKYATPAESRAEADTLDGAAWLARAGERELRDPSDYTASVRAELAGDGVWPDEPERLGFGLPHSWGRPEPVHVALVPAAEPWLVPITLHHGGWNKYPAPGEHAAIMRYWYERYGAEPVVMTETTVQYAVARPPSTRPEALALAWEYQLYNDGDYDYYLAETLTDLAASLLDAPVWRMWWD